MQAGLKTSRFAWTAAEIDWLLTSPGPDGWPGDTWEQVEQYLAGRRTTFNLESLDWSGYSVFAKRVFGALIKIPWGHQVTYGQLATGIGTAGAARAVGSVLHSNRYPILLPCHRVIGRRGIGGYAGPDGMKHKLLAFEAIVN